MMASQWTVGPTDPAGAVAFVHDRETKRFDTVPSATGGIARLACARAREAGIELEPLLKKAGLTVQEIDNAGARLGVRNQIALLNLIAQALKDEFLGFHLACNFDLRMIGWLYYVLASSDAAGEAMQRAARYSSITNEGVSLRYIDNADITIVITYVGVARHLDRHQIEFYIAALVRSCRELTRRHLQPSRVRLTHHRNESSSEFNAFLGVDVEFGADADEIAFPGMIRDLPVVSADPYLHRLLIAYCEEALVRREGSRGTLRQSVENAIAPLLPHGKARLGDIAHRLGTSQRTLARRLAGEGLSFSTLLEELRVDLAMRHIADPTLSVSQIAWLLGYQEVSAFTHAFKRWTGQTPREMRSS
jgi:AraC-like DNA-binding protein